MQEFAAGKFHLVLPITSELAEKAERIYRASLVVANGSAKTLRSGATAFSSSRPRDRSIWLRYSSRRERRIVRSSNRKANSVALTKRRVRREGRPAVVAGLTRPTRQAAPQLQKL